jgi:hypothetical protein
VLDRKRFGRLATGQIRLQLIVEDVREPDLILRSDRGNFCAKPGSANMNNLEHASQHLAVIELDHEFERIAGSDKQSAFDPHTHVTHIENPTGRRHRSPLKTTGPAHLDP